MIHRINDATVEELNRVLTLVQQTSQNQQMISKGTSSTLVNPQAQTSSTITSPIIIKPIIEIGDTTIQPIIVLTTVSTNYPTFGYGSQWGESWGL